MKKLFKFMIWLLVVLLVIVVGLILALRIVLNTEFVRGKITTAIESATGRQAELGKISLTLLPLRLVVRDAAIKELDSEMDFVSIDTFLVHLDAKKKEVTQVTLKRPTLRLAQYADGGWNFSDMIPAAPEVDAASKVTVADAAPDGADATPAPTAPEVMPSGKAGATPVTIPPIPISIQLVEITDAVFEFTPSNAPPFTLSGINVALRDVAPGKPILLDGAMKIGRESDLNFSISVDLSDGQSKTISRLPLKASAKINIQNFDDLAAFLPEGMLPFDRLSGAFTAAGMIGEQLSMSLTLHTQEAVSEAYPVAFQITTKGALSIPEDVLEHIISGTPLNAGRTIPVPPATLPEGELSLVATPEAGLILKYVRLNARIESPRMSYGKNQLSNLLVALSMNDGEFAVSSFQVHAYGGNITGSMTAQLLETPLRYQAPLVQITQVQLAEALKANDVKALENLSGAVDIQAQVAGSGMTTPLLKQTLTASASLNMHDIQTIGSGGNLMDQVWVQLDHPALLQLLPRLNEKVAASKQAVATVTTTRYENATAQLTLQQGKATLSNTRLALPDYAFTLGGTILPFDNSMQLDAVLRMSPKATTELTGGKDLSAYIPYENGGMAVPIRISGELEKPRVMPDMDVLLKNMLKAQTTEAITSVLSTVSGPSGPDAAVDSNVKPITDALGNAIENMSEKDRKKLDKGLRAISGFLER